jgi:mannose-6-phosphate isomerase-like protein (cupin superfamily)
MSLLIILRVTTLLATTVLALDDLNIQLKLATTTYERFDILSPSSPLWRFDFHSQPGYTFSPGSVVNANAKSFPALEGVGMTLAQLNLGPCAMLPPHLHPRADNVVIAVTGNTTTWMVNENGVGIVVTELTPGMMTVFPRGSVHTMQNNGM